MKVNYDKEVVVASWFSKLSFRLWGSDIRYSLSFFSHQTAEPFSIEEVAYYSNFIDKEQLLKLAGKLEKSGYGEYLQRVANA